MLCDYMQSYDQTLRREASYFLNDYFCVAFSLCVFLLDLSRFMISTTEFVKCLVICSMVGFILGPLGLFYFSHVVPNKMSYYRIRSKYFLYIFSLGKFVMDMSGGAVFYIWQQNNPDLTEFFILISYAVLFIAVCIIVLLMDPVKQCIRECFSEVYWVCYKLAYFYE